MLPDIKIFHPHDLQFTILTPKGEEHFTLNYTRLLFLCIAVEKQWKSLKSKCLTFLFIASTSSFMDVHFQLFSSLLSTLDGALHSSTHFTAALNEMHKGGRRKRCVDMLSQQRGGRSEGMRRAHKSWACFRLNDITAHLISLERTLNNFLTTHLIYILHATLCTRFAYSSFPSFLLFWLAGNSTGFTVRSTFRKANNLHARTIKDSSSGVNLKELM